MNEELKDYYKILGVTPDASLENIRRARERELGLNWSNPIGRVEVERAYAVLSNPESRREYDEQLKNQLSAAELEKRNANTFGEYQNASKGFEFFVDPETLVVDNEIEELEEEQVKEEQAQEEQVEDIYSSSDQQVHNLLDESAEEEQLPVDNYIIPIQQKQPMKKQFTKCQKVLMIGGAIAIGGIPGLIIANAVIKKLEGKKTKLHNKKHKKISEIKTQESKLIEEYNEKMDKQINELLARPHNNYNLQIAKTRYENQIELLQKRIELKLNENVKRGGLTKYKLECVALKNQLDKAKERLQTINSKINEYNKKERNKNPLLNKLNENLYEVDAEIKKQDNENKRVSIKKLNVQKDNWRKRRDLSAKSLKVTRKFVGKIQDGAIRAFDNVCSVKEIFTPYDELDYINEEQNSPEIGRTR